MASFWELWRGMELVWLTLFAALAVVLAGLIQIVRRFRWTGPAEVHADEGGASYTLAYVLLFPVYFLFVCLVVEATFLLVAKVGTLYAAHCAARSAVVWQWAEPVGLRRERTEQAAAMALAPFSSAQSRYLDAPVSATLRRQAFEWAQAYRLAARAAVARGGPARPYRRVEPTDEQLVRHYLIAAARTTTEVAIDRSRPDGAVTCTVTYRAPLYIPGAARILDPDGSWPYQYPIRSTATLPAEGPLSADGTLGIDYRSR